MKILVVGGTGFIGGAVAKRLAARGDEVHVSSRRPPSPDSEVAALPFIAGDYVKGTYDRDTLAQFDAVVMTAGNDARQRPEGTSEEAHLEQANIIGLPRFFAEIRDAGVPRAVYVGTFYFSVLPEMIARSAYVRSRYLSDKSIRALATDNFNVCCVNPPYILGWMKGIPFDWVKNHARYALGKLDGGPIWAPPGGVNFMSLTSLVDAVTGALDHGEGGKAYLIGDENLSYAEYFNRFRRVAGLPEDVETRDENHPALPDWSLYAGRGGTAWLTPSEDERRLLGYRRNDVENGIREILGGAGLL